MINELESMMEEIRDNFEQDLSIYTPLRDTEEVTRLDWEISISQYEMSVGLLELSKAKDRVIGSKSKETEHYERIVQRQRDYIIDVIMRTTN